jgi:hypothetical protein
VAVESKNPGDLLEYAIANPYVEAQNIKPYQHQYDGITITLIVDEEKTGRLSLTHRQITEKPDLEQVLSWLNLPNCHFSRREKSKGFVIYRYRFDLPQTNATKPERKAPSNNDEQPLWKKLEEDQCHIATES